MHFIGSRFRLEFRGVCLRTQDCARGRRRPTGLRSPTAARLSTPSLCPMICHRRALPEGGVRASREAGAWQTFRTRTQECTCATVDAPDIWLACGWQIPGMWGGKWGIYRSREKNYRAEVQCTGGIDALRSRGQTT